MRNKTFITILLALVAVAGVHYGSKAWKEYQHHYLPNEDNHFLDDIHEDIKAKLAEIFGE